MFEIFNFCVREYFLCGSVLIRRGGRRAVNAGDHHSVCIRDERYSAQYAHPKFVNIAKRVMRVKVI